MTALRASVGVCTPPVTARWPSPPKSTASHLRRSRRSFDVERLRFASPQAPAGRCPLVEPVEEHETFNAQGIELRREV